MDPTIVPTVRRFGPGIALALVVTGCAPDPRADARMVSEWMHTLYGVVRAERLSPPVAARFLAYAAVGLHEGLAAATPSLRSAAGVLNGLAELPRAEPGARYRPALVAVAAEGVVLDSLLAEGLPTTRATVAGLVDSLERAVAADAGLRDRSRDLGRRIGGAIVRWSRRDGFDATRGRPYRPPVGPGFWSNDSTVSNYASRSLSAASQTVRPDDPANLLAPGEASDRALILNRPKAPGLRDLPPANMAGATEPYWGTLRPFLLQRFDECPVPGPPGYSIDSSSALHRDAMAVYRTGKALTPEHRTIALYWADNAGETGTPGGHWVAIAAQMISARRLTAGEAARLFLAVAAAQADAFLAAWGYKYRFNLIRPRAYIRRVIDPEWEPLIPTPPFPEYPSGHSTQSAAASIALTGLIGDGPFADSTSVALGHAVRSFPSFLAAADEAGMSRVYGGIHFPAGNTGGQALGRCVGRLVVERLGAASPTP